MGTPIPMDIMLKVFASLGPQLNDHLDSSNVSREEAILNPTTSVFTYSKICDSTFT